MGRYMNFIKVDGCLKLAKFGAWEWLTSQPQATQNTPTTGLAVHQLWHAPSHGKIKINVDASWDNVSWTMGWLREIMRGSGYGELSRKESHHHHWQLKSMPLD